MLKRFAHNRDFYGSRKSKSRKTRTLENKKSHLTGVSQLSSYRISEHKNEKSENKILICDFYLILAVNYEVKLISEAKNIKRKISENAKI